MNLSYWVKVYESEESLVWDDMVYARVNEQGALVVDPHENPEFFHMTKTHSIRKIEWEPAWKDVTDEYRLTTGSVNVQEHIHNEQGTG